MYYPLPLLKSNFKIFPLFGDALIGEPYQLDLSPCAVTEETYNTLDFQKFQAGVFEEIAKGGASWGIGPYLEDRSSLLRNYPDMIAEGRVFHVGLDIVVPPDLPLFAPIKGVVFETLVEKGLGSYGGIVILEHFLSGLTFYSLYGHLKTRFLVQPGQKLEAGEIFGEVGAGEDSGGWFTHVHLQILTEKAMAIGWKLKGYVSKEGLPRVGEIFPTPYPLFRF